MADRAQFFARIRDSEGRPVQGVEVHIYQENTTTPIVESMFTTDDGAVAQTNPIISDSDGLAVAYLEAEKKVTVHPVKTGYTFSDFTGLFINTNPADVTYATTSEIADVAGTEGAGTSDTVARGDHVHALPNDIVTFAKMQNIATDRLIGRDTASSGDPEEVSVTNGLEFTGGPGIGIANDGVTYARMQNVSAASRLLGRGSAAGSGDVEEITLGTGLSMSGTTLDASADQYDILFSQTGTDTNANSSAEENMHSSAMSITGGTLVSGDFLRLTAWGDLLNNTGGSIVVTFRFKYGATTLLTSSMATSVSTSANRRFFRLEYIMHVTGASAQRASGSFHLTEGSAGNFPIVNFGGASYTGVGYGTGAESVASTLALAFSSQFDTASANCDIRTHGFLVERLRP